MLRKILLIITAILLFSVGFKGQPSEIQSVDEFKFRIKFSVLKENNSDLFPELAKNAMIDALQKYEDIVVVENNEDFLISLAPVEIKKDNETNSIVEGYAIAYQVLSPFSFNSIKDNIHFNARDKVKKALSLAYIRWDFGVILAPKNGLNKECQSYITLFNFLTLQPVRELRKGVE